MADGVAPVTTRADSALVKALARAFRYQRLLDEGLYASISEMAAAERIERGYLGTLLRLTLLAPKIVEALIDGREQGLSLPRLLEPRPSSGPSRDHQLADKHILMSMRKFAAEAEAVSPRHLFGRRRKASNGAN